MEFVPYESKSFICAILLEALAAFSLIDLAVPSRVHAAYSPPYC